VRTATLEARLEAIVAQLPPADLTEARIAALASEAVTWARKRRRG